ncbi:signal peptidase I [Streptomyces apocyni]|uniref:signal peptidase I n=1 Tax=Streptomyces apocyni TaxID=2654677 RepID=UPI0012E9FDDF|nr:signal peptidase I [Streptomyces apocyni]
MGSRGRPRTNPDIDTRLPTGTRRTSGPVPPGRAERRKLARKVKRRRRRSALREIPLLVGVAVLIALVLKTFLVQAFVIPSGSMEQTINIGDRVIVDKLTPFFGAKPQRGDVVVFRDPGNWLEADPQQQREDDPVVVKQVKQALTFIGLLPSDDEQDLIKRVVGVGGDRVTCCDEGGRVTVNGVALNEPYLKQNEEPRAFDVTVPQGRLFVLGDHRDNSADSRFHLDEAFNGTVSEGGVVGTAKVIAWPVGNWRTLESRGTYASVPASSAPDATATGAGAGAGADAASASARGESAAAVGASHRVAPDELTTKIPLPTPAELPLVMGVVGLRRAWDRQWHGMRSGCGGFGRRRTIRTRRTRG